MRPRAPGHRCPAPRRRADSNWTGWNNQNPLDAALAADRTELASWLQANGGHPAAEPPSAEHTP
jgi:hypothetical protein